MLKRCISSLLVITLCSTACDKSSSGSKRDPLPENKENEPTEDIEELPPEGGSNPDDGTNSSDSSDKQKPGMPLDPFDALEKAYFYICRTDEPDNKEYCLNTKREMPSDIDPEKKIPKCINGMLDNDVCKPLSVVYNKDTFSVLAGETARAFVKFRIYRDEKYPFEEDLISEEELVFKKAIFGSYLTYDYPTKFDKPTSPLDVSISYSSSTGNLTISHLIEEFWPVTIVRHDKTFKTGPMKLYEFVRLCGDFDLSEGWGISENHSRYYENSYSCSSSRNNEIRLICDDHDQHCKITHVEFERFPRDRR